MLCMLELIKQEAIPVGSQSNEPKKSNEKHQDHSWKIYALLVAKVRETRIQIKILQ